MENIAKSKDEVFKILGDIASMQELSYVTINCQVKIQKGEIVHRQLETIETYK